MQKSVDFYNKFIENFFCFLLTIDEANITLTDLDFTIRDSRGCSLTHQFQASRNRNDGRVINEQLPRLFNDPSIFCADGEEIDGIIGGTCPGDSGKL